MTNICGFWNHDLGRVFDIDYAFDAETELIGDDHRVPRFVIADVCDGERAYLLTGDNLTEFFRLHGDLTVIMHNAAFDLAVVDRAVDGDFDVYSLVEAGRVRDTMILHRLYELATTGNSQPAGSALEDSCRKHLGLAMDKEAKDDAGKTVRTNFAHWIDSPAELPEEYIGYVVGASNIAESGGVVSGCPDAAGCRGQTGKIGQ